MNAAAAYVMTVLAQVQDRFESRKDRGATAVEYGLMVGLIAVAIIVVVTTLGTNLKDLFSGVAGKIDAVPA